MQLVYLCKARRVSLAYNTAMRLREHKHTPRQPTKAGTHMRKVTELIAGYDPFHGLGFAALDGQCNHLPPPPTLAEVMAHPVQLEWRHPATCGHTYDIGRLRFFVERHEQGLTFDPITLTDEGVVVDGHHRLAAAFLIKLNIVEVRS